MEREIVRPACKKIITAEGVHLGLDRKHEWKNAFQDYWTEIFKDEDIKFQAKDFEEVLNRDGIRDYLYDLICEKLIMKYKEKPDYTIGENVEYDNEVEE